MESLTPRPQPGPCCWLAFVLFGPVICEQWERDDTGHGRSFKLKRLRVIMEDKCEPVLTGLSLLLFAKEVSHPAGLIITPPLGQEFLRTKQLVL